MSSTKMRHAASHKTPTESYVRPRGEGLPTKVAVIGGSGLEGMLNQGKTVEIETEYGTPPPITIGTIEGQEVGFIPRHGTKHETPPHKVNYRAIVIGLRNLGVERIIATNAAGAINERYTPGDIAIPVDVVDFTKTRPTTLYDKAPVTHVDVTEPYCPSLRRLFTESAGEHIRHVWTDSVMACTEGPRFETPAEIRMFRLLGCDLVGMTAVPEVFLAREAGLCYASICFVSNMAAGIQARISHKEVEEVASKVISVLRAIVSRSIARLGNAEPCECNKWLRAEV